MTLQKIYNLKVVTILLCLFLSTCSYGQKNKSKVKENDKNTSTANIDKFLKKQILLTNRAEFTNNRKLQGASGFLIKYNDSTFAVTARHLLGEAGGIEPEIVPTDLSKSFGRWEMMPRVLNKAAKEIVKLNVEGLDFSQSINDILLLKVNSGDFEIEPLIPNFELPAVGEQLFLIGCPYSESNCKQNVYPAKFEEYVAGKALLGAEFDSKVNLAGFSGAPLVNSSGEVVGVLVSDMEFEGKTYILATHIKEIQKIKF